MNNINNTAAISKNIFTPNVDARTYSSGAWNSLKLFGHSLIQPLTQGNTCVVSKDGRTTPALQISHPKPSDAGQIIISSMRSMGGATALVGGALTFLSMLGGTNCEDIEINSSEDVSQLNGKVIAKEDKVVINQNVDMSNLTQSISKCEGTIEGNDHTLTGLTVPLIKNVESNGIVKDLKIKNAKIILKEDIIGAIVQDNQGKIENIIVSDSHIESTNGKSIAGGVVGTNAGTLSKLTVIDSTIKSASVSGGVLGRLEPKGSGIQITDLSAAGNTIVSTISNSQNGGSHSGGIVGTLLLSKGNITVANLTSVKNHILAQNDVGGIFPSVTVTKKNVEIENLFSIKNQIDTSNGPMGGIASQIKKFSVGKQSLSHLVAINNNGSCKSNTNIGEVVGIIDECIASDYTFAGNNFLQNGTLVKGAFGATIDSDLSGEPTSISSSTCQAADQRLISSDCKIIYRSSNAVTSGAVTSSNVTPSAGKSGNVTPSAGKPSNVTPSAGKSGNASPSAVTSGNATPSAVTSGSITSDAGIPITWVAGGAVLSSALLLGAAYGAHQLYKHCKNKSPSFHAANSNENIELGTRVTEVTEVTEATLLEKTTNDIV